MQQDEHREIPEHEHTHSLYVHCLDCKLFGIGLPTRFIETAECGNCGSLQTVKYYPSCCIVADRQSDAETEALLVEASRKIGW